MNHYPGRPRAASLLQAHAIGIVARENLLAMLALLAFEAVFFSSVGPSLHR
jgi:hypothetical protein